MFPTEHNKRQSCMRSHSDPQATVHLGLGISGQGTFVHVPSAAHTGPSFSRVYVCKYTHTVPEQAGFPKPHVQANTCTPYCKAAASTPQEGDASRSLPSAPPTAKLRCGTTQLHCQHGHTIFSTPCVTKSVGTMSCFQSK